MTPADLPTSDISTKRIKLPEGETSEKEEMEKSPEEKVWPEPAKRVAPAVRTAVVLSNGVSCPDGCQIFSSSEGPNPDTVNKLRYGAAAGNGSF